MEKEQEFPFYVMSKTEPNKSLFVFRENGQELKVNIQGYNPQCSLKLTPQERIHITENFIEKTNHNG